MYTLEKLQNLGVLGSSIQAVEFSDTTITITEKLEEYDHGQNSGGIVTVDNPIWIATIDAVSMSDADDVYSSDGEEVGRYCKSKNKFYRMSLQEVGGSLTLVTKKIFSFKEEQEMADVSGIDMDVLEKELNGELNTIAGGDAEASAEVQPATAFDVKDEGNTKELSEKEKKAQDARKKYDGIRERINKSYDGNVVAPQDAVRNNQLNGRLIAFVTPNNDTIKLSIRTANKLDANGNTMLDPSESDPEVIKNFKEKKRVPAKSLIRESVFAFTNSKPSKPKAIIFTIPAGTDLPLTSIGKEKVQYDETDKTLVTHVMDYDSALLYLAYNFADTIHESEEVMGSRATVLRVQHDMGSDKNGNATLRNNLKVNGGTRKSVIVNGNFLPLKTFRTISTQDLTEENKKILNLNVEAAVVKMNNRSAEKAPAELSDEAKASYKMDETGVTSSAWFNEGKAICVTAFDNPEETISNVRIPAREKVAKKQGGYTYKFIYDEFNSEAGPLNNPEYEAIIKATGFTKDVLQKQLEACVHSKSKGKNSKAVNKTLSYDAYLRAYAAREFDNKDAKSFSDVQRGIDQLTMLA